MSTHFQTSLLKEALDSLGTSDNAVSDINDIVDKSAGDLESTGLVSGGLTSEKLELFTTVAVLISVKVHSDVNNVTYVKRLLIP